MAKQELQAAFIKDLFSSFKKLGEESEIGLCLCKNKGQVYRRLEIETDLQTIFDYQIIGKVGFTT